MFSVLKRKLIAGLLAGSMLLATAGAASADIRDFQIVNSSGFTILRLYVGPSESADWGEDILGQQVLDPGMVANVSFGRFAEGACLYDVMTTFTDESSLYALAFDLCTTSVVELGPDGTFYYR